MKYKVEESKNQSITPFNQKWATSTSYKINYKIVYKLLDS